MKKALRFSEHFNLNATQWELDFVDIPLETDICLFVDPYAISILDDNFSIECNDMIITYFDMLLQGIKSKDKKLVSKLLLSLHEPNDTHLGFSKGNSNGRGIGKEQANEIYRAFLESEAAQTGFLSDISDCALLIQGINRDKISDITTNIIKQKLIEYTKQQCDLHNIPTRRIQTGTYLDFEDFQWKNTYENLPFYQNKRIILVPKSIVRYTPEVDAARYYQHFVLEFLQAEHSVPGDALAYILKNGKLKVYKKDLKAKYPLTRQFLYEFSKDHPDVMRKYKEKLNRNFKPLSDSSIEYLQSEQKKIDINKIIADLTLISVGNEDANKFHIYSLHALSLICGQRLRRPIKEQEINEGRKRIDIIYDNSNIKGFFCDLNELHHIKCPYVFVECKNYTKDIKNPEFDQMLGRFSDKRGNFGIIICRKIDDKEDMLKRCKDVVNDRRGLILVLDDDDIVNLLQLKGEEKEQEIDDYFNNIVRKILL